LAWRAPVDLAVRLWQPWASQLQPLTAALLRTPPIPQIAASIGDPALAAALSTVEAPALFVGGAADRVAPPDDLWAAAEMAARGRAVILERCGHVPMIERPAAYHQALRAFLLEA
jgi:pimeloyl-ACP methyl ester carboxylesterase